MSEALIIPPLPHILGQIQQIMDSENPDIALISKLIKEDIGLYTLFLSAANSPWMGLSQPTTSIEHAVMLMGLERIYALVQGSIIRTAFAKSSLTDEFWLVATEVAGLCSDIAKRFTGLDRNQAYSIGMLHNVGVAIMLKEMPDFDLFLKKHRTCSAHDMCILERRAFKTDHYVQAAYLAKNWRMGKVVAQTIRLQPIALKIIKGEKDVEENIVSYLAILVLALNISDEYRKYWNAGVRDEQAAHEVALALDFLQINQLEFEEIKQDMVDQFNNEQLS